MIIGLCLFSSMNFFYCALPAERLMMDEDIAEKEISKKEKGRLPIHYMAKERYTLILVFPISELLYKIDSIPYCIH